ncbi:MAG: glycoside hydrolase family 13 protein [Candidatus Marinimicrobia bacterium]|nr:glycoside hydrolase family 13 protein [Candidatus Neomarinimicrobiota bacterium]
MNKISIILIFPIIFTISAGQSEPSFPDWTQNAIWYQIFPERFRNGDPSNDPTIETLTGTWPYDVQTSWDITPWTDDWYKLQPWEIENERGFYYNAQLRRYGGDIQGIIDQLDYLHDLGVNALYLNPVFESPSSHKYGAVYYHHIDNNFGPDPQKDVELWAMENPVDPDTWQWTTADSLFLQLVQEVHSRDMRIIIDGVFNHVGIPFWALNDVREFGEKSQFADWFTINSWDDPDTPEDEFEYAGWFGIRDLPELRENDEGLIPAVSDHIHAVVKRWMDPNGDGDPSDGVDGWRLDVAEMVNIKFWKKLREWAIEINPNAYLTGEVWWEDYPNNKMFNAAPWLKGDAFHSVMNYRFGDAIYKYFLFENEKITATQFQGLLDGFIQDYGYENILNIQNMIGSHDNERFASACVNPDRWIDHANNLSHNPEYLIRRPNAQERKKQEIALGFQFLFPGAPYIYYGDEVGMWGADDPDERKPMVWNDLTYEDEQSHPFGQSRPRDKVDVDENLMQFYKNMIDIRKAHPALSRGDYQVLLADDERDLFAFTRQYSYDKIIAVFNGSNYRKEFSFEDLLVKAGENSSDWNLLFTNSKRIVISDFLEGKSFNIYVKK